MSPSGGRAREALRSADFRRLLGARLVNQLGDGLFQSYLVAVLVFLNPEVQGTAIGVAKAYAILIIPFSLVGPVAGVLIDRWSRRRILVITPVLKAAAALALVALPRAGAPLYALALVAVSLNRFFLTTATSSIPAVVVEPNLLVANSMSTVGGTVVTFVGIVAGTKLADPLGAKTLLFLTAASWIAAALASNAIARPLRPPALRVHAPLRAALGRVFVDLWAGVRRLASTPAASAPIASMALDQLLIGFITVLSLVVFKQRFHQGVGSYGNLVAAGGAGVLAGTLSVAWLESHLEKARIIALSFALSGLACMAVAPAIGGATIVVVSFALGLTFAWRKISADTLVQAAVPDRFRGRVFSVYDIAYSLSRVTAAVVAVPLIPRFSAAWLLGVSGLLFALWTPVLPAWIGRPRWATIEFYAGGRADEVPRSVVIAGERESVGVDGSSVEERRGERVRRFRLRTPDGRRLDVSKADDGERRWRIEREVDVEP